MSLFSHNNFPVLEGAVSNVASVLPITFTSNSEYPITIELRSSSPSVHFQLSNENTANTTDLCAYNQFLNLLDVTDIVELDAGVGQTKEVYAVIMTSRLSSSLQLTFVDFSIVVTAIAKIKGTVPLGTELVQEEKIPMRVRVCSSLCEVHPLEGLVVFEQNAASTQTWEFTIRNKSEVPLRFALLNISNNPKYEITISDYDQSGVSFSSKQILESYNSKHYTVTVRLGEGSTDLLGVLSGNFVIVENLVDDRNTVLIPVQCQVRPGAREEWLSLSCDGSSDRTVNLGKCFIGSTAQKTLTVTNTTLESLSLAFAKREILEGVLEFALENNPSLGEEPRLLTSGQSEKHKLPQHEEDTETDDPSKFLLRTSNANLGREKENLEEVVLHSGQHLTLSVRFRPFRMEERDIRDGHVGSFKADTDIRASKGGQTSIFTVTCKGDIFSSRIMLQDNNINFRDTAVGTAKLAQALVRNQSDIDGGVCIEYDSKILLVKNPQARCETTGGSSRMMYIVLIPAACATTLDFEICPLRVNPKYTKQVKITNLNNENDFHILTVRSNNVAGAEESSHAKYYNIEGTIMSRVQQTTKSADHSISMKRAIFFNTVVSNFPAIRSFVVTNNQPVSITLSLAPQENGRLVLLTLQPASESRKLKLQEMIDNLEGDMYLQAESGEELLLLKACFENALATKELAPLSSLRVEGGGTALVYVQVSKLRGQKLEEEVIKKRIMMTDAIKVNITQLGDEPVHDVTESRVINVAYHLCHSFMDMGQRNVHYGAVQFGDKKKKSVVVWNNCEVPLFFYMQKAKSVNASHISTDGISVERYFGMARPFGKKEVEVTYIAALKGKFNEQIRVVNVLNEEDAHLITIKAEVERIDTFDVKPTTAWLGLLFVGDLPTTARILTTPANQGYTRFSVNNISRQSRALKLRLDSEIRFRSESAAITSFVVTFEEVGSGEGSARRIEEEIERLEHKLKIHRRKKKVDKIKSVESRLIKLQKQLRGEVHNDGSDDSNSHSSLENATSDEEGFDTPKRHSYSTEDPEVEESLREGLALPLVPPAGEVIINITVNFRRPVAGCTLEQENVLALFHISEAKDSDSTRSLELRATLTTQWSVYKTLELSSGRNNKIALRNPTEKVDNVASSTGAVVPTAPAASVSGEILILPNGGVIDFGEVLIDRVAKQVFHVLVSGPTKYVMLTPTLVGHGPSGYAGDAKFRITPMSGTFAPGAWCSVEVFCTPQRFGRQVYRCMIRDLETKNTKDVTFLVNALSDEPLTFPAQIDFGLIYVNKGISHEVVKSFHVTNRVAKKFYLTATTNVPVQMQVYVDRACSLLAEGIPILEGVNLFVRLQPRLETQSFESGASREFFAGIQLLLFDSPRCDYIRVSECIEVKALIGHSILQLTSPREVNLGRVTTAKYGHKCSVTIFNQSEVLPLDFSIELKKGSALQVLTQTSARLGPRTSLAIPVTLAVNKYGILEETILIRNHSNPMQNPLEVLFILFADDNSVRTDLPLDDLNFEVVSLQTLLHATSASDSTLVVDRFNSIPKQVVILQSTKDLVLSPSSRSADVLVTAREADIVYDNMQCKPSNEDIGSRIMIDRRNNKVVYIHPKLRTPFTEEELQLLRSGKKVKREGKFRFDTITPGTLWSAPSHRCLKVIRTSLTWCVSFLSFQNARISLGKVGREQITHSFPFMFTVVNTSDVVGSCNFSLPPEISLEVINEASQNMTTPPRTPQLRPRQSSLLASPQKGGDRSPGRSIDDPGTPSLAPIALRDTIFEILSNSSRLIYGSLNMRTIDRSETTLERKIVLQNVHNPWNSPELIITAQVPKSMWQFFSDPEYDHKRVSQGRAPVVLPPLSIHQSCSAQGSPNEVPFVEKKLTIKRDREMSRDPINANISVLPTLAFINALELVVLKYTSTLPLQNTRWGPDRSERDIRIRAAIKPDSCLVEFSGIFTYVFDPVTASFESSLNLEKRRTKASPVFHLGSVVVLTENHNDDELPIHGSFLPPETFELSPSTVTLKKTRKQKVCGVCEVKNTSPKQLHFKAYAYTYNSNFIVTVSPVEGIIPPRETCELEVIGLMSEIQSSQALGMTAFSIVVCDITCPGNAQLARGTLPIDDFIERQLADDRTEVAEEAQSTHSVLNTEDTKPRTDTQSMGTPILRLSNCAPLRSGESIMRYLVTLPLSNIDSPPVTHDLVLENTSIASVEYVVMMPNMRSNRQWLTISRDSGKVQPGEKSVIRLTGSTKTVGSFTSYLMITTRNAPLAESYTIRCTFDVVAIANVTNLFDVLLDTRQVSRGESAFDLKSVFYGESIMYRYIDIVNRSDMRLEFQFNFGKCSFYSNTAGREGETMSLVNFEDPNQRPVIELHCSLSGTSFKNFVSLRLDPRQTCRIYIFFVAVVKMKPAFSSVRVESELLVKCRSARESTRSIPIKATLRTPSLRVPVREITYFVEEGRVEPPVFSVYGSGLCEIRGSWHLFQLADNGAFVPNQESCSVQVCQSHEFRVKVNVSVLQDHLQQFPQLYLEERFIVYNALDIREKYFMTFHVVGGNLKAGVLFQCHHGTRSNVTFNRLEEKISQYLAGLHASLASHEIGLRASIDSWVKRLLPESAEENKEPLDSTTLHVIEKEIEEMYRRVFDTSEGHVALRTLHYLTDELISHAMMGRPNVHFLDLATLLFHGLSSLTAFAIWKEPTSRVLKDNHLVPKVVREMESQREYFNQYYGCWEIEV